MELTKKDDKEKMFQDSVGTEETLKPKDRILPFPHLQCSGNLDSIKQV